MSNTEYLAATKKVLENPAAYGINQCCLCLRKRIHFVGIMIPDEDSELHRALNPPKGKRRTVFYGLCEECSESDEPQKVVDRVEANLLRDLSQRQ